MKKKKTWIAKKLKRDYSVIKREVKRNSGKHLPYNAVTAQKLAGKRSKKTNIKKLDKVKNSKFKELVTVLSDFIIYFLLLISSKKWHVLGCIFATLLHTSKILVQLIDISVF